MQPIFFTMAFWTTASSLEIFYSRTMKVSMGVAAEWGTGEMHATILEEEESGGLGMLFGYGVEGDVSKTLWDFLTSAIVHTKSHKHQVWPSEWLITHPKAILACSSGLSINCRPSRGGVGGFGNHGFLRSPHLMKISNLQWDVTQSTEWKDNLQNAKKMYLQIIYLIKD